MLVTGLKIYVTNIQKFTEITVDYLLFYIFKSTGWVPMVKVLLQTTSKNSRKRMVQSCDVANSCHFSYIYGIMAVFQWKSIRQIGQSTV